MRQYWPDPKPERITYDQWNSQFRMMPESQKKAFCYLEGTSKETQYLEEPRCFAEDQGDLRLKSLKYDNSLASIRLWSFLLSEEERLHKARLAGKKIIGTLKDLGTMPVLTYSSPDTIAFYPDGAWWIPCIMEMSEGLLKMADSLGLGEEVCPSRATLSAYISNNHFPRPDYLIAAVGCCCDDFSAIMQRLADMGTKTSWWELPFRGSPSAGEEVELLPTGFYAPKRTADFLEREFDRVRNELSEFLGHPVTDNMVSEGIEKANRFRQIIGEVRDLCYGSVPCPFPALETQICEMIAIHFCSDREEATNVLAHVLETVRKRVESGAGVLPKENCRAVWINPVADLRVMNLFEDLGGAIAGTEYLFRHALVQIPTNVSPMRALALTALSDPMIGPAWQRAKIVIDEVKKYKAEGIVVSNIPGASHSATEGNIIRELASKEGIPVLQISVPPLTDATSSQLGTRFEAFFELIRSRRKQKWQPTPLA
ncbi:MAG: 2-hydroxyacyl-CoA dehydratase [Caldisericia bacterium]|nr:2-hydroxyacyl-CoA dehydratase [Caldisericia bacterium]